MINSLPGELWKPIAFDFEFTNEYSIEVSNYGRLLTYNKLNKGALLKGSMINGYRIIRLKFYKPRDAQTTESINLLQQQVSALALKIKTLKKDSAAEEEIKAAMQIWDEAKKKLSRKYKKDIKKRTIHYHGLFHRLVAQYFCEKPSEEHTVVAHIDYNKLNNQSRNLKWMTPEENYAHQQKSPFVIAEKQERHLRPKTNSKATKLTVTKVMLLKKLLNNGKPLRTLVKQFKITDTQILRIKRGENWADIEPAK